MRLTSPMVFALFFLAPLVAEFLLGNVAITWLPLAVLLAPMYGGGAVLVRETARRLGLGWPGILLLALAYAVVEEAFVDQSLFNPHYLKLTLLDYGYIASLGIGAWWTVFVLGIHVVWSIATPIAICEALARDERHEPWMGTVTLVAMVVIFVAGCAILLNHQLKADPFRASHAQIAASIGVVFVLLAAALLLGPKLASIRMSTLVAAPSPSKAGAASFLIASAFLAAARWHGSLPAAVDVALLLGLLALGATLLLRVTRLAGWTPRHEAAVAGGTLMTYAWHGFVQTPSVGNVPWWLDAIGNAIFASGAVWLLVRAWKRTA